MFIKLKKEKNQSVIISFMNLLIPSSPELHFLHAKRFKKPRAYWTNDQRDKKRFLSISAVLKSSYIRPHSGKVFNFPEKKDHRNSKLQPEKKTF